jgi:hypothetical protein
MRGPCFEICWTRKKKAMEQIPIWAVIVGLVMLWIYQASHNYGKTGLNEILLKNLMPFLTC